MTVDHLAEEDFQRARSKAFWNRILGWLTGEQTDLLPLDVVRARVPFQGQHDLGLQAVPIRQIVGSESRYRDFDRAFLPRQTHTRDRWVAIDRLHYRQVELPPVSLYKIGDIYFVRDGNHRISVARERGQEFVDAYVTELTTPVPLTPDTDLHELVLEQERLRFLQETGLDRIRPEAEVRLTLSGQYGKLSEHIQVHRWFLGQERGAEVPYEEAVASWYDRVYMPLVQIIREHGILNEFPGRTEADLYLWIIEHSWYLREAGGEVPMEQAATDFARLYSRRLLTKLKNLLRRSSRRR
ncbi:MAG: DUF4032 domain-containing protein [Anaerolineales bacterium]